MKLKLKIIFSILIAFVFVGFFYKSHGIEISTEQSNIGCHENLDDQYDYMETLNSLIKSLNHVIPNHKEKMGFEFGLQEESCNLKGFWIHDLTDTSNYVRFETAKIHFIDNHIYHFYAAYPPLSYSNIAVLTGGKVRVFEKINCETDGSSIAEIKKLLDSVMEDEEKDLVFERLENYRSFGNYGKIDDVGIELDCN